MGRTLRRQGEVVDNELKRRLERIAETGTSNKGKRDRQRDANRYLDERIGQMNYHELFGAGHGDMGGGH
jgi:hypothetical protein